MNVTASLSSGNKSSFVFPKHIEHILQAGGGQWRLVCLSQGVVFSEANGNLSLWEAAVGSSYMCNKEQNYTITSRLNLFTFNLQVQPFAVKKGVFSTGSLAHLIIV